MDTSPNYIKMSDCPEIQEQKKHDGRNIFMCREGDESGDKGFVWLPQQDQIQEMMPPCACLICLTTRLYQFTDNHIEGLFDNKIYSMEQLWLALYMWEKHTMIWNLEKKEWIKNGK